MSGDISASMKKRFFKLNSTNIKHLVLAYDDKIPFMPWRVPIWDPAIKGLSKNLIIYPFRPCGFNFSAGKFADWKAKVPTLTTCHSNEGAI